MKTNYVLIDFENVQVKSLALLKGEHFRVKVFIGPKNTKLPVELVLAMQKLGEAAEYIMLQVSSANALDFHIIYYLGALTAADPEASFHIISKDTGFDSLLKHLKTKKINCVRSVSIEEMSCFKVLPAEPAAPTRPAPPKAMPTKPRNAMQETPAGGAVSAVMTDLINRKEALPRTTTSLMNTIRAKLKDSSAEEIQGVFDALVKQGSIKVNGKTVIYSLPVQV